MNPIKDRIINEHNRVMTKAKELFPKLKGMLFEPIVTFHTNGRSAGLAYGPFKVSYNTTIFSQDMERFIRDTIPHEIAHVICSFLNWDKGHGRAWKRVCALLGGNSERCFDGEGLSFKGTRTQKKYEYVATCGTVVLLSAVRHGKIKKGHSYIVPATNGKIASNNFTGKIV